MLRNVALRFVPGEFVAVVGPSGSGKSTLIQALLGAVPSLTGGRVSGEVAIEGEPVLARGVVGNAGKTGVVLQDPESQLTNLDVEGEVVFGPENLALSRAEIAARLERALATADIAGLRNRFVYALSGGQKQRVAIAAALAMEPRVLLLDSPTSNLDPIGTRETLRAIVELWESGAVELIVLATHRIDDVLPYLTRLVVLDRGEVVRDGPVDEVLARDLAYLRDDLGIFVPEVADLAARAGRLGARAPTSVEAAVVRLAGLPRPDGARVPAASTTPARPDRSAPPAGTTTPPRPVESALPARATAVPRSDGSAPPAGTSTLDGVPPAVEVRDLHFAYVPGRPVLTGIDLTLRHGELVALLGQNGTGKTTLAKNIAGLYRPSRGSIAIDGIVTSGRTAHLRSGAVGYVFQYPDHQFVTMSVFDEVAYGPRARGVAEPEIARRVEAMLERFGLTHQRARPPYGLSMGEKRRLSVSTMLVLEPRVLILDEPTMGQDRANAVALMEVLRGEARERGMTIVQITHDMEQAAEYADRAVVMDGGHIVFDGAVPDLFDRSDLLARCHLRATDTATVCRLIWPDLAAVPTTPNAFARAVAAPTAAGR